MTLRAFHREMFPFERIGRCRVIFRRESRRLEPLHRVAGRALRTTRPFRELAVVRIGFVAIHAMREGYRLLEISSRMAARAIHSRVFPQQRILGLGVVEVAAHRCHRNLLPTLGAVTRLAALRETALVWIRVAIRALAKRNSGVPRFAISARRMAFFALNRGV